MLTWLRISHSISRVSKSWSPCSLDMRVGLNVGGLSLGVWCGTGHTAICTDKDENIVLAIQNHSLVDLAAEL